MKHLRMRGVTITLVALSMVVPLAGAVRAAEGGADAILDVFPVTDEAFVTTPLSESPHGPANIAAFEVGEGWAFAGVARYDKGKQWMKEFVYWYHEVVFVTGGRATVTVSLPPYKDSESTEVKRGDLFAIRPSMKVSFEPLGDGTFEIFWAVPQ